MNETAKFHSLFFLKIPCPHDRLLVIFIQSIWKSLGWNWLLTMQRKTPFYSWHRETSNKGVAIGFMIKAFSHLTKSYN